MPLKGLMPLQPWKTPTPPFPKNQNGQYIKLKGLQIKDGTMNFWQLKTLQNVADYSDIVIPYEGFFEFVDNHVIKTFRRWIDKLLGEIFSLPRFDRYKL
jgi:hypothetical protein